MRSVVFRFEDITAFSVALGDAQGALALPDGETVADGEWVLATFEIGSRRRATAAAARGVRAAGDTHLSFERRDWDRLLAFVAARSEHMRAAKPVASSGRIAAAGTSLPPSTVDAIGPMSEIPPSSAMESVRMPVGARVLLVDDDDRTRDEVRRMLADIGLAVEVVATAAQASVRMGEASFDALVLDFHAEGMEPLDFVRGLRKDPVRAPLPVLFLSDRPSSRDVVEAFASGADDFLPKPFRAPELGARIFGLLRRARIARVASSGGRVP
ncbi:MAG: response regulator transcription factor [Labilithrix sp.]|nr:response regulator transcription factor [Labilithrix sp.]